MDGVLIDSEPIYMQHVLDFYNRYGIKLDKKEVAKLAGSSNEASWEMMANWWKEPITPKAMETFYNEQCDEEKVEFSKIINPYVKYILPRLKGSQIKLAIASSSPMETIKQVIKECEIDQYFDYVVSGHSFQESKPNPEIYLHTLKELETDASNTLIIEDSTYGIQAANNAKIPVIALKDERFYYDQSSADYMVDDLLEAYYLIMKLRGA